MYQQLSPETASYSQGGGIVQMRYLEIIYSVVSISRTFISWIPCKPDRSTGSSPNGQGYEYRYSLHPE